MTILFILIIILFTLLIAESIHLNYCTKRIPLRILINGTRGKSSVTTYVAAGLRCADRKTVAKITGIIPTIIYHDGSHKIIKRKAPARVQEQFKLIRLASSLSADCLVLECMSISPELQILESRIFKPHIYVITNIKDDHREQMGNKEEQVKAICGAIPSNSIVVTDEKEYLHEIENAAKLKNSSLVFSADSENLKEINFPRNVIESNINLAFAVCKSAGVEKNIIINAFEEEISNSEKLLYEFTIDGKNIKFLNGFAVNDVSSAKDFFKYWEGELSKSKELNIVFNSRFDRPLRSSLFAVWLSTLKNLNEVILTGSHSPRVKLELIQNEVDPRKISYWAQSKVKNALVHFTKIAGTDSIFVGLGNISGDGHVIIDSLRNNASINRL